MGEWLFAFVAIAFWLVVDAFVYAAQWQRSLLFRIGGERSYNRGVTIAKPDAVSARLLRDENDPVAVLDRPAVQGDAPSVRDAYGTRALSHMDANNRYCPAIERAVAWLKTASRDTGTVRAQQVLADFTPAMAFAVVRREFGL